MASAPVVIDLISSSPRPPSSRRHPPGASASTSRFKHLFDVNSDEIEFPGISGDLDFPVPQVTKKRRLSPHENEPPLQPGSASKPIDLSDEEEIALPTKSRSNGGNARSIGSKADLPVWDDIQFTSSAPEARRERKKNPAAKGIILSDDIDLEAFDSIFDSSLPGLSQPLPASKSNGVLSERTTNLLANLSSKTSKCSGGPASSKFRRTEVKPYRPTSSNTIDEIVDIFSISLEKPTRPKPSRSTFSEADKENITADRAAVKAAKNVDKEVEKEQKRLAKEQKAQEKQRAADIAEVNKSKTDKKESVKEMILDLPRSLEHTSIGNQVEAYMEKLEVLVTYCDEEIDLSTSDVQDSELVGNIIRWRRKVEGVYDHELDCFKPLSQRRIEKEKHILIHLTGTEFATIAARQPDKGVAHISEAAMKANLDAHVNAIKRKHKGCIPIYLIEGLTALVRKNKNAKNRAFMTAARSTDLEITTTTTEPSNCAPSASQAKSRKRKQPTDAAPVDLSFFTHDLTASLLLHLQISHSPGLLLHHVPTASQSAHWITTFTSHLSTRPYRLRRNAFNDAHAGFCIDAGQVKTGVDATDTYLRMLQELPRVTVSMAHGIRDEGWASVGQLVRGFRQEGRLMLEDVHKAVNRDGGLSERRIGPAVSKRLYKVFFSQDPSEINI